MLKHIWTVLCKESVIDGDTNNISLLNVMEKIESQIDVKGDKPEIVKMPFHIELVTLWQRTKEGDFNFENLSEIISPDGKVLVSTTQNINFPKDKQRMRNRVRMEFIPLTNPGVYVYRTTAFNKGNSKNKIIIETPLEIDIKVNRSKSS